LSCRGLIQYKILRPSQLSPRALRRRLKRLSLLFCRSIAHCRSLRVPDTPHPRSEDSSCRVSAAAYWRLAACKPVHLQKSLSLIRFILAFWSRSSRQVNRLLLLSLPLHSSVRHKRRCVDLCQVDRTPGFITPCPVTRVQCLGGSRQHANLMLSVLGNLDRASRSRPLPPLSLRTRVDELHVLPKISRFINLIICSPTHHRHLADNKSSALIYVCP
jgi:hypothetical protein